MDIREAMRRYGDLTRDPDDPSKMRLSTAMFQSGLSLEAIGVLGILMTYPYGKGLNAEEFEKTYGVSRYKRQKIFAELERARFLVPIVVQGPDGLERRTWIWYDEPIPESGVPDTALDPWGDPEPGFIYYARFDDGVVKIGQSVAPIRRISELVDQPSNKNRKLISAFCYPVDHMSRCEWSAHCRHIEQRISRSADTFAISQEIYEARREEMGGVWIPLRDGRPG